MIKFVLKNDKSYFVIRRGISMLLKFIFKNSFSYKEEAYFSMEAVKGTSIRNEFDKIGKHRILKSAIIFGPNASGKSNMIKSLKSFRNLILKNDIQENPYPTYAGNEDPIFYQIVIYANNNIYRYSVSYLKEEILQESLEMEKNGDFEIYFQRKKMKYPILPDELKPLVNKTRKDNLFLITAKTFNDKPSLAVFRWFRNRLIFISRDTPPLLNQAYKIHKNIKEKEKLLNFLKAADLNITDFEVVENNSISFHITGGLDEILSLSKRSRGLKGYNMTIRHKAFDGVNDNGQFSLDLSAESDGTKKLIALAIILVSYNNSTILIDEFDDSFHVELSKAMIEVFNSNKQSNQFILTSHELALMDSGFKKEQIYFTEKADRSTTELYSVYDFKSEENRQDYSYVKRYQKGMFGAIPEILVGKLKESLEE
ncbi:abortive phage resistance protein [Ligilactobacillus salivarius]|nr:abortive phage resistance protein [Ligilactobacillus salivarius]